jgi:hypothetical protein
MWFACLGGEAKMKGPAGENVIIIGATSGSGQTLFLDGSLTLFPDFRTAWQSA